MASRVGGSEAPMQDEVLDDRKDEENDAAAPIRVRASTANAKLADLDLGALYRKKAGIFANALRRLFGAGPPDPEDVVQQAFQKLVERSDLSDIRDPEAFLWRTARNLVINEKRAQNTRSKRDFEIEHLFFPDRGVALSPERVTSAREQLALINETLGKMPVTRRRAFLLHRVQGLSLTETARRLHLSRSAITKHVYRAAADIDLALDNKGQS